jgi:tRNA threonylcarbamoyladenosine biosynthesis protein TsaE
VIEESYTSSSEAATMSIAATLAATLSAGAVLLLHGDLGAGKTAFVRGLAIGVGLDEDVVSSPTFTLVHEYRGGRVPLFHADLYRLPGGADLDDLGFDEALDEGVVAIEWPARLRQMPAGAVDVRLDITGPETRAITIRRPAAR